MFGKNKDPKVLLYELTYDEESGEYTRTERTVRKSELPSDAMQIIGDQKSYFIDHADGITPYINRARATDLYLYASDTTMNGALVNSWKGINTDTIRKIVIAGVAVVVIGYILYVIL